jgi:RNA polymerase sigma-70 factor (ECF subfamily)
LYLDASFAAYAQGGIRIGRIRDCASTVCSRNACFIPVSNAWPRFAGRTFVGPVYNVSPNALETESMSPVEQPDDLDQQLESLLIRCAEADAGALQRLYELTSPVLFACLTRILRRRALAEEALQDVFVSIWQRAGQFSAARGRPMSWMMSIARYRAIDLLRHERSAPVLVPDLPERAEAPEDSKDDAVSWMPASALVERCLSLLTDRQKNCLELAFIGGNSHEDIARLTGNPLGTVKSWIRRGLQSLRKCLEGLT